LFEYTSVFGSGRSQRQSTAISDGDQRRRSATAISDRDALLDPMFMVTSGSFIRRRVVDGIAGVKG
jgi:hypothetical protein